VKQKRSWPFLFNRTILVAFWSLPVIFAFYIVWKHAVPVPFWDEWETPGAQIASYYRGTLSFAELYSQHNEHRLLFPRLIYLPLAIVAGWDVRHGMVLTLCFACFGSAGLYRLLRRSGDSAAGRGFIFGMMNLLLFSPRQYETFLVGAQGQTFVPTFALVLALLVNLSERSVAAKTIANATLALISTYSFGNGMLVWLLAFPLETSSIANPALKRRRVFWRALYILFAAASIGCYFISYQHPPLSPPIVSPTGQLSAFLRFVLVWIGSLFTVGAPAVCGGIVLLLFIALAIAAIRQSLRTGAWQSHYPWLLLGCYALISGCVAAAARLGFGYSMAGDARYAAFSVFLYIAVLGLGFSVFEHAQNRAVIAHIALPAAVVSVVFVLTLWTITFKKERRFLRSWTQERKHSLLVVRWAEAIPQNPEIALLSPYSEAPGVIHTLAEHDALRPRLVSQKLARVVNESPNWESASAGILEQAKLDGNGHVFCKGWARVPDQDRPADCVVLGFETDDDRWQPFCMLETGEKRPDIAQKSGSASLSRAGFFRTIDARSLPRSPVTMRAWAIDLQNPRAFPMAGAIRLQAQP
jgi:hypothetical protein